MDSDRNLEVQIDRLLKKLPEMKAPASLFQSVMAAVEVRATLPWYRQPWQTWPPVFRAVAMVMLLASFGAVSYAAWQLTQAAGYTEVTQELRSRFSGLVALFGAVEVLVRSICIVLKQLGTPVLAGLIV